jgi:4a-hydroxytetrahydrobiopterin dehydratase
VSDRIPARTFQDAGGVEDWRVVGDGACASFRTGSFAASARLVQAIADLEEVSEHPPAVDVRPDGVTVRLVTVEDDYFGMTERDVRIARAVSAAARELGAAPDPSAVQSVLVIPGASDVGEVMPFWQAVLGYRRRPDSPDEDLVDPMDRGPAFWFEAMDEPRSDDGGGAIHVAVWVPVEEAKARVEAALAAGGRLVRDTFAPAWWTLADAAGNEADVASIAHRD